MRYFPKFALLCALFSVSFLSAPAQKRWCPEPPPSPFKHSGQIVTTFDPAAKRMRTTLRHPRKLGGAQDALYLGATFLHGAAGRSARPSVELVLISTSREIRYRDSHGFSVTLDGRRRALNAFAQYRSETGNDGSIREASRVTLTYESLLDITRARRVEAQLGPTRFELTDNHLEALREIVSLMAPPARGGAWEITEK